MKKEEMLLEKLDELRDEMKRRANNAHCKFFYSQECLSIDLLLSKLDARATYGWISDVPDWVFGDVDLGGIGGHELKAYVRKLVDGINHLLKQPKGPHRRPVPGKNQIELEF